MQLTDLLSRRPRVTIGEVSQTGVELIRQITAAQLKAAQITAANSVGASPAAPSQDARYVAQALTRFAEQGGIRLGRKYRQLQAHLQAAARQDWPLGDLAISLYQTFPPRTPSRSLSRWAWLTPSLLGLLALTSWGLAVGLLLGV